MNTKDFQVVNKSLPKVDGINLVTGSAKYTDDFDLPGTLYAKVLTSPYPHARILSIKSERAKALSGVHAVLTHKDLKPVRHTTAGQSYPEPSPYDTVILPDKARYVGDRVAFVAAQSVAAAEEALDLIKVEYEELPALLDMEEAVTRADVLVHEEPDPRGIGQVRYAAAVDIEEIV